MDRWRGKIVWVSLLALALVLFLSWACVSLPFAESVGGVIYDKAGVAEVATSSPVVSKVVTHIKTPVPLKAVYMSSWVAGSPSVRARIIKLAEETEINAVVIDVKDSTGAVSFKMDDPKIIAVNPFENRISDIAGLVKELHGKNIYLIARIAVFEDPILAKRRPDLAVKKKSTGGTWKDRKGLAWTDPGSMEVWDYNIAVAKAAYAIGFDELNFDYIRFPSDGDTNDMLFTFTEKSGLSRADQLMLFFYYLHESLSKIGAPTSADLFGMTMTNTDDLGIGQVLENTLPYFDYVAPMVYPSHYPPTFHGWSSPATKPYELIKFVMAEGMRRAVAASSSPDKLRPWLQDFDLGAVYDAAKVRAQIQATYDVGLDSWMLWDPGNHYTPSALLPE